MYSLVEKLVIERTHLLSSPSTFHLMSLLRDAIQAKLICGTDEEKN